MSFMQSVLLAIFVARICAGPWIPEMENKLLYQGDMILSPEQQKAIKSFGYASATSNHYWPLGKPIPYEIADTIGDRGKKAIQEAIADYHKFTCLRFVPRRTEKAHIYFWRGPGCDSPVGYKWYGNRISLGRNCWQKGVVIHEIAHTLGMFHEHSRMDRDQYVKILWSNIQGDVRVNFQKEEASKINSLNTPYDLKSVMHYPGNAFGGGRTTIEVLDTAKRNWIGQRDGLSEIDKVQINRMYKCGQTPTVKTTFIPSPKQCKPDEDLDTKCVTWAASGYCLSTNDQYLSVMKRKCCKSCKDDFSSCADNYKDCNYWTTSGQCVKENSKKFMRRECKKSCGVC